MKIMCSRVGCPARATHVPVLRAPLKETLIGVPPIRAVIDLPLCPHHLRKIMMHEMLTNGMRANFEAMAKHVSRNPPDFDKAELRAIKVGHPDYLRVIEEKTKDNSKPN